MSFTSDLGPNATLANPTAQYADYGFIAILALTQRLRIDLLPVTWQALPTIGRGGESTINQALVNVQTSFAFKRYITSPEKSRVPFQNMAREMVVLSNSAISEHPYIVSLEGICWDIPHDNQIWPVLVFEKTHLGDLERFSDPETGTKLSMEDRLNLCVDIGIAIKDMHFNNIIHGDVKPQNVLIFNNDGRDRYTAKLADFGFSTWFAHESDSISMPKSRPWHPPEWHHRGFSPVNAKRMDVYSFGMLCLWLLFRSSLGPDALNLLERWKSKGELLEQATRLVAGHGSVNDGTRAELHQFFNLTLAHKAVERTKELETILPLLLPTRSLPQSSKIDAVAPTLEEEHFQVASSVVDFYGADFRLRSFIAHRLEDMNISGMPVTQHISQQNVTLQLAVCYAVGFGVRRDKHRAKEILSKGGLNDADLKSQIRSIKHANRSWGFQNSNMSHLLLRGHVSWPDHVQHYRENGLLEEAERCYKREIKDTRRVFKDTNWINLNLRFLLGALLSNQARWEEAENVQRQEMETSKTILGLKHSHTLCSMTSLAATLWGQGKVRQAEELQREVVELCTQTSELEHDFVLLSKNNLASTLMDQGQWGEAEELKAQVLETNERIRGPEHPVTLNSMANLASTFYQQRRFNDAEKLEKEVVERRKKVLGLEHPETLSSMVDLASIQRNLGKDVAELEKQLIEASERILSREHPDTLLATSNLASTLFSEGQLEESQRLSKQVVEARKRALGPEHPDTLRSISSLAATFSRQGQLKEAEDLHMQVIEARKRVLGPEHPDTLKSITSLAAIFSREGRWKEAEKLQTEAVEAYKTKFGLEDLKTLTCMHDLVLTYHSQGKWKEAAELGLEVTEIRKKVLGPKHPDTSSRITSLAGTFLRQGRWKEAEKLQTEVVEIHKTAFGLEDPKTLTCINNLVFTYHNQGKWKEAAELGLEVIEIRKKVLGPEDTNTLTSMINLAAIFFSQRQLNEAEELQREALEIFKRTQGREDRRTLTTMNNLAMTWKEQGRDAEALALLEECFQLWEQTMGPDDPFHECSLAALNEWKKN